MDIRLLREYIRKILLESHHEDEEKDTPDDLLVEPDEMPEEEEKSEVSAGGVVGASTPVGTDASYPASRRKSKKSKK